ncbi:2-succinyl-5-enolpyruvyl-6-hydroxy-3-cyclohexene-1-carboxylic-acid synthase [Corynebacterium lujinxingii]|uniref:2-succinyl-5-enolpyruvyl-6-hydroxy-3-cyclohexene-1-carboxylate synthase n=1 Tax=Corynebacterium lujinxingii TaxID=2763010 RepID=A0A7H0JZM2_9CORY|nr:2-succinyl-5-enolpyruvyl-6-hydroxy-3-cyclohexene-1-carboxylic-acid synthase [Corynebacterium lujinxingii]MBC3179664.1 2-succinyl-5-enolpyruvyl-6-hydroxy-3-cyclohexene-1-carboxylic-acid synthase [Corynebacterium lujinxingii]NNO10357.1 2-succinyl-5-enolpyruvyl-6-hydroxy-3-cyclohexene-1-carboxylic-acid synthase [Corynebacterium lujinxingii]QNP90488.1 2-succinyl-5-enolpyruvyl-6-hydroxy-3-cyclohexene-1-carboxylic-acid synthase [Corynebacterium lujinxingii]
MQAMEVAHAVAGVVAKHCTDVVMSPGSRNSPLAYALLARRDITVHMRIDERSAAFTALGLARVQRRHVAVVMTSGTAVANAYPALIEAHMSHTPLAVVSADRPERLVGTGASQTIWQQGIFAGYAETQQVTSVEEAEAVSFAAGQVHVNVALDTPLVPEALPEQVGSPRRVGPGVLAGVDALARSGADGEGAGAVDIDLTRDTLVIAGDEAWDVPGLEHVPTIAEPTAPTPFHQVHPLAARFFAQSRVAISHDGGDFAASTKPDQVVVVGHPTLHRDVMALLADPDIEVIGISRTETFTGQPDKRGSRVNATGQPTDTWIKVCEAAGEVGADTVRQALADKEFGFTGLHVAAAVCDTLAVGDTVVLGSSNPVRDASFVGMPFDGVDTYSARGAAGIDGTVSQAVGVALAAQALRPDEIRAPRTVALMGDLTFLHDINGLLIGPDEPRPGNLTIVVANDDGGGIFEALEPGSEPVRDVFERVFGTPHGVVVEKQALAYGANYRRAETLAELNEVLLELEAQPDGITVVEAVTTRETRRALAQRLAK